AAEEREVHDRDRHRMAVDPRSARDHRFIEPALPPVFFESVDVALGVPEGERIGGGDAGEQLFERMRIGEQRNVLARTDSEMEVALGADQQVPLQVLDVEDLPAAVALPPKPVRRLTLALALDLESEVSLLE